MAKLNETISVDPNNFGAYIELFERGGKRVGRMNFFDGDTPRTADELRKFHSALGRAIETIEEKEEKR